MEAIAAASGMAVQTVYCTFKTKSLLLREGVDRAGAGHSGSGMRDEPGWMPAVLTEPDPDRALALAIEHGADLYARATPLWPALLAASVSDPDVDGYIREVLASRRAGMSQLIHHLGQLGYMRPGLPLARATDIVFAVFSHETYLTLRDAGSPLDEVKAWFWATLRTQLTTGSAPTGDSLEGSSLAAAARRGSVEADP